MTGPYAIGGPPVEGLFQSPHRARRIGKLGLWKARIRDGRVPTAENMAGAVESGRFAIVRLRPEPSGEA